MKINSKKFHTAYNSLRYATPDDAEIEFSIREENIQEGKISSCLSLTASWDKPPSSYDSLKTTIHVSLTLEVYPDSENTPSRLITIETRDLNV